MIWLWLYIGGYIAFLVPIARFYADDFKDQDGSIDQGDLFAAITIGMCLAFMWPLLIPGYYAYWMLTRKDDKS